jgi:Tfp pilus assembly protein PilV
MMVFISSFRRRIHSSLRPSVSLSLRPSAAFTLIEAVIAIVILSIAIPTMLYAVREVHHKRVGPVMTSRARWLAVEKLEDIIADRHSSTRGWSYVASGNYPAEGSLTGFPGFARSVLINETGVSLSGSGTGYKTVTVTVKWTDSGAVPRSLALSTVLTDYTP